MGSKNVILESGLVAQINELHKQAECHRDLAVANAGQACRAAIECGALLIKAKEENAGEFGLWLESNCNFSHDTATRYMRVSVKYSAALRNGSLDFQTLKELYIATGIMPPPEHTEPDNHAANLPAWMKFTIKLDKMVKDLKAEEKESLRAWCLETLKRL